MHPKRSSSQEKNDEMSRLLALMVGSNRYSYSAGLSGLKKGSLLLLRVDGSLEFIPYRFPLEMTW
jgi:hypothetical protein